MDRFEEYEALASEDNITAVRERRVAIGDAIDKLIAQLEAFHAEREKFDERDQQLYAIACNLDEAYARINRGVRYTAQARKRLVRRCWADETHQWVEQYLLQWVKKLLQEGPQTGGTLHLEKPGRFAIADVIKLMEQHPEEFEYAKGAKPQRKYARADFLWSLKKKPARYETPTPSHFWNVEADFSSHGQERTRTFSESMHEMLEQAIQSFYAKQSSSVFTAFADFYFRDFARAYHSMKQAYELGKIQAEMAQRSKLAQPAHSQPNE